MRTSLVAFLLFLPLCAQTTGRLVGFGYRNPPAAIEAAPGQVLIVSLYGAQARLTAPVPGEPKPPALLATTVAGFSADLLQSGLRTPVGINGVSQTPCAAGVAPCDPVTNITLQVPFQLAGPAILEVKEGAGVLAQVPLQAVSDNAHIITSCDQSVVYYTVFGGENLQACTAAVVRPRGGLITPRNPVHPGESLVAFGYGMGHAAPSPLDPSFRGGLTTQPFILRYAVAGGPAYWAQAPDGVSLTTTSGNYQIHFTMPPLPDDRPLPPCAQGGLYGNVRVSISGVHSTDTFELCVTP